MYTMIEKETMTGNPFYTPIRASSKEQAITMASSLKADGSIAVLVDVRTTASECIATCKPGKKWNKVK